MKYVLNVEDISLSRFEYSNDDLKTIFKRREQLAALLLSNICARKNSTDEK